MYARIYQPSKTAMQSGKGKTRGWVLEFEQSAARRIDPLMGWTSSNDMNANQVRLSFETKEAAVAYATEHGIPHKVSEAHTGKPVIKAYSDNFSANRRKPWTH